MFDCNKSDESDTYRGRDAVGRLFPLLFKKITNGTDRLTFICPIRNTAIHKWAL